MDKSSIALFFAVVLSVSGCHALSVATSTKMMIPDIPTNTKHYDFGISVAQVKGGAENFPARYRQVFNYDMRGTVLQEAIIKTLDKSNLFTSVTAGSFEKYVLEPEILFQATDFEMVSKGSFTFTMNVKYTIIEKQTNRVLYTNQFTSACVITADVAIIGGIRHALALECSGQDNLSQFLVDLNSKDLINS